MTPTCNVCERIVESETELNAAGYCSGCVRAVRLNELTLVHPIYSRIAAGLSKAELLIVATFLAENFKLNNDDYSEKVNRLFVYGKKPKNAVAICDLLLACRPIF